MTIKSKSTPKGKIFPVPTDTMIRNDYTEEDFDETMR